ncbi:MAG TPA: hypothetical protein VJC08_05105 [bacterium]|nr:hypothetical protein [bacterium]
MSNFLIRGISIRLRQRIQKFAERRNLSTNQLLLEIIDREIERMEGNVDEEKQRAEAFKRMKELREELSRKYGKQEDSTKLIRQMRDERSRRLA